MKKSNFVINVWDLLISSGKRDEISFKNEKVESLNSVTDAWISWNVVIQSYDQNSLLVTLYDLNCTFHEECDRCTKAYDRVVQVPEYSAKFQIEIDPDYDWDDEVFQIDKNENIDIQDMIINAINLQEPFTKLCENCKTQVDVWDSDDELENFEWTWNVYFSH